MTAVEYIDHLEVGEAELETLTDDVTIGSLTADEKLRGEVFVDVNRLRQALVLADEHFSESTLELGIVEHGSVDGMPLVLLLPSGGGRGAIALAPRKHPEDGYRPNGGGEA